MVIVEFSIQDKLGKIWYFEGIFLLANTGMKLILKISFLILNNIDIQFHAESFTWSFYIIAETLSTTKQI